MQTFEAVSGRTGELLWTYVDDKQDAAAAAGTAAAGAAADAAAAAGAGDEDVMNLYTGQFVDDVDGDGVPDILNIHGGDPFAQPGQCSPLRCVTHKSYSCRGRTRATHVSRSLYCTQRWTLRVIN